MRTGPSVRVITAPKKPDSSSKTEQRTSQKEEREDHRGRKSRGRKSEAGSCRAARVHAGLGGGRRTEDDRRTTRRGRSTR